MKEMVRREGGSGDWGGWWLEMFGGNFEGVVIPILLPANGAMRPRLRKGRGNTSAQSISCTQRESVEVVCNIFVLFFPSLTPQDGKVQVQCSRS